MEEQKKNFIKQWLNTGTKKELCIKGIVAVSIAIYIVYQLGYAFGAFLAHIGV